MRRNQPHELTETPLAKGEITKLTGLASYLTPYKKYIVGAIIALTVTSSSVLALGKGVGYLVDEGLGGHNPKLLDAALLVLLLVTAMLAVGTFARFYFVTYVGERVVADIRRDIYRHIIHLSPEFFETTKSGDILSRMTTDTTLLQVVISSSLSVALRNMLMLVGGMVLLFITSPKLTGVVLVVVPMVVIPIVFLGRKLRKLSRKSQEKVSDLTSHAEESISGIKAIQAFVREDMECSYFQGFINDALKAALARIRIRAMLTALVIMFVFGSIGFVLWIGGHDVLSGKMSAGKLSSFIFYSLVVAGATGAISEVIGDLQRAAGAAERLMELLNVRSSVADPAVSTSLPEKVAGNIVFDNVTFTYPTQPGHASLKNFSLKVAAGQTIALVGPSGAGKSTVFQLLLRFYDTAHGNITIDGVNIRHIKLKELRNVFGLVPQEPIIFSGTAYDNILLGRPGASKKEVEAAAEAAAATEFIQELPKGWHSFLGEKGVRLSGGQKQRIAIARAFLKNPAILLLDEATSALDAANEKTVQKAFKRLMENRTTIVIAHRLSTIQNADRIIVLDGGMMIEEGSHKSLIKEKGIYAKLAKLQFDG